MTPLFKKLNLGDADTLLVLNAPDSFETELSQLQDVRKVKIVRKASARTSVPFGLAFAVTQAELDTVSSKLIQAAADYAVVWVAYPKKTSKRYRCEFNRDHGWTVLGEAGFEPVRQVAIDSDWSALRFRRAEQIRSLTRNQAMAISAEGKRRTAKSVPAAQDVAAAATAAAIHELESAVRKVKHCLEQLSDDQLWWRPDASMNSIANLMLHMSGNLGQWIVAGVGGAPDTRDRPREFAERGPIRKAELLRRLQRTVADAKHAITDASLEVLLAPRRIQGFEVTGLGAIFHSVAHFWGHTQEIVHLTRCQLGDGYRFDFVPRTPEQGAG